MTAKAVLTQRPSSFKFNEKSLDLSVPAKIGRASKEEKSSQENGYFDSKVLSKPHALLLHQGEEFFLLDTGSSNGSFVNNIRLSKPGVESELTEIYTGDIIRFGSDVVDKARNVTQKAVVIKLSLFNEDGSQYRLRPANSRMYRPSDNLEDIETVTKNLQDSLSREKQLEEKLTQVMNLVQSIREKNDGHTVFNTIEAEVSKIFYSAGSNNDERKKFESLRNEKAVLRKEKRDLEDRLREKEKHCENLQSKAFDDSRSIASMGGVIQKLRGDIVNLENVVKSVKDTQEKVKLDYEEKMLEERRIFEAELERIWKKDKETEEEKMRLEERILYLMQYEPDSTRSSAISTPTTIRQLRESANLSGMSTPTSLFNENEDFSGENDMSFDKLKEKAEMLDSVNFELEVTKRELEMFKDENEKIRKEITRAPISKTNEEVEKELQTSREQIQYLLSKVAERDEQLDSLTKQTRNLESENTNLKSQDMESWVDAAESDFETVFQENCLNKSDKNNLNQTIKQIQEKWENEGTKESVVKTSLISSNRNVLLVVGAIIAVISCFIYTLF